MLSKKDLEVLQDHTTPELMATYHESIPKGKSLEFYEGMYNSLRLASKVCVGVLETQGIDESTTGVLGSHLASLILLVDKEISR